MLPVIILFSCKKYDNMIPPKEEEPGKVYQYIKKLGHKDSEIKDIGEYYLVDGCILFAKNSNPDFSIFSDAPRTKQYGTSYYVGYQTQPNIMVKVDPSMNSYISEIYGAVALWNDVPNCRLKFSVTVSPYTSHHILIEEDVNLGWNVCGSAYFPVNAQPGQSVRINTNIISGLSSDQIKALIAHELGHAIGFRHTNWVANGEVTNGTLPDNNAKYSAMHILGTPSGQDPNSIMNGGTCGIMPTVLSDYDIVALQFLYPHTSPAPGAVPIFRYSREVGSSILNLNHFFTIGYDEIGDGQYDYKFEGIGFYAFPYQVAGSEPVYRYYNASYINHVYTINPATDFPYDGYNGYYYNGPAFYAYRTQINNSVPVYRYYSPSGVDHHYTKNTEELNTSGYLNQYGYSSEGIYFYAY